jgi:hypothetical protein
MTFNSMHAARQTAEKLAGKQIRVNFYSAQYPEDHVMLPSGFFATPDLDRSILDIYPIQNGRKLPFLADIISRAFHSSDDEYIIYTNVDIGLMPSFYVRVVEAIRSGLDAFTINRRSISDHFNSIEQLPQMYADPGEPHRGWDCFVFRRDIYLDMRLGQLCVGAPLIGLAMLTNLLAFSTKFKQFTDEYLTFHLGNDRKWGRKHNQIYAKHNQNEIQRLLPGLDALIGGFPPSTPLAIYLRNHSNPIRAWLYDQMRSIYIPAKFTKPFKHNRQS